MSTAAQVLHHFRIPHQISSNRVCSAAWTLIVSFTRELCAVFLRFYLSTGLSYDGFLTFYLIIC